MSNALTAKDQELLSALRLNARESVTTLARKLGLSRSTVQDRLKRLESRGVIAGYAVKLGDQVEQAALKAFVTIEIEPRRSLDVVRTLGKLMTDSRAIRQSRAICRLFVGRKLTKS